jgi:hypothetical protein
MGANPVVCTASDQCHAIGTCNPATGICSNPSKFNGATCDDGNACTQTDSCQFGVCTGSDPVECTAWDPCHDVGTCDAATGLCSNPSKANGTACNDGNACTQTDTCQSGVCTGSNPIVCTASDPCHDAGACNSATGICSTPSKPDGTVCDDGDACTQSDTCRSGACIGSSPVTCAPSDACHDMGSCDPATGLCSNPVKPDGSACSDACTPTGTCHDALCSGPNTVVCAAMDACHLAGVCSPSTGLCSNPIVLDGTACNDGNACTTTDACASGVCTGFNPVVCVASDGCHQGGTCAPETGTCSNPVAPDGTSCSDGDACTRSDACVGGVCIGSSPVACTARDGCHEAGTCDSATGICTNPARPDGVACSDACTPDGTCVDSACIGPDTVVCTPIDVCHVAGTCDPATGVCSNPAGANGTACDDGNACTTDDACVNGTCTGQGIPSPAEVDDGVRLSQLGGVTTITWNPAAGALWSEIARGLVGAWSFPPAAATQVCLDDAVFGTATADVADPESGDAFWYLIRGANACGRGVYGFEVVGGVPIPRVVDICP